MINFWKKHKGWILNLLAVTAPVVAGVASGGVFTVPVLIAAGGAIAGKLAASPLDHK